MKRIVFVPFAGALFPCACNKAGVEGPPQSCILNWLIDPICQSVIQNAEGVGFPHFLCTRLLSISSIDFSIAEFF